MKLDKSNGDIELGGYIFNSKTELRFIDELNERIEVNLAVKNDAYISFKIKGLETGFVFLFQFNNELLSSISFFLENVAIPFMVSEEERSILYDNMLCLSPERKYNWGSIELYNDIKGGTISIYLKYFN